MTLQFEHGGSVRGIEDPNRMIRFGNGQPAIVRAKEGVLDVAVHCPINFLARLRLPYDGHMPRAIKQGLSAVVAQDRAGLDQAARSFLDLFQGRDFTEGRDAFLQKRQADFPSHHKDAAT